MRGFREKPALTDRPFLGRLGMRLPNLLSIGRGQHLFGTTSLADFFGVGRQQIRTRLALMKKAGFLTIKTTNK
jgi:hypothetical protein